MVLKKIALGTLLASSLYTSVAQAVDLNTASLRCVLNRSESLFIFASEKQVFIKNWQENSPKKLKLASNGFSVYRCPGCFGFSGSVNGKQYSGHTSGVFSETGIKVALALKIDGVQQHQISCYQGNEE